MCTGSLWCASALTRTGLLLCLWVSRARSRSSSSPQRIAIVLHCPQSLPPLHCPPLQARHLPVCGVVHRRSMGMGVGALWLWAVSPWQPRCMTQPLPCSPPWPLPALLLHHLHLLFPRRRLREGMSLVAVIVQRGQGVGVEEGGPHWRTWPGTGRRGGRRRQKRLLSELLGNEAIALHGTQGHYRKEVVA